ncbi:ATP-binding protein [Salinicola sp. RZ23]|uniref:ATP-binding protein n=1 Tax=Salinicola sp. RZ23 TaxID=1949087 RepID=UPI000DA1156F|nr:ATP-binding protein [Salinicola sp. RZ23]
MKPTPGLRRQIIQSLAVMALGIICLSVIGTYVFYAFALAYLPGSISDTLVPSRMELGWIVCTIIAALSLAVFVAIRLSRRLITPLNSVAHSLREVAQGRLDARAPPDDQATGETAQLVRDFNAMAERLQGMTREREFWNAAVAHELRTPLTVLRGRLQGLAEGVFTPSSELFEGLLRQVEGLGRLVEDLRVVSLKESGHLEVQRIEVGLAEELDSVLQAFVTPLADKGLQLHQTLDTALRVECDAVRIRQALMALLENALRHADPGNLRVSLARVDDDCQLSVEDDGPGIDSALATEIFESFRRVEPSRSRQSGGSGLGLAVVKAIAEAHGGQAYCQPSAHGGSRFVMRWPLAPLR